MYDAASDFEENLMIKIAWYYYMENLTQQSIANQLGISRMRVIKLLEKARQTGVVQFRISSAFDKRHAMETRLMETYNRISGKKSGNFRFFRFSYRRSGLLSAQFRI